MKSTVIIQKRLTWRNSLKKYLNSPQHKQTAWTVLSEFNLIWHREWDLQSYCSIEANMTIQGLHFFHHVT